MRTTPEENARIGARIAQKLSAARGPVAVLLPGRGVSAIDQEGQPFDDPVARRALNDAIRAGVGATEVTSWICTSTIRPSPMRRRGKLLALMKRFIRFRNGQ